jgi:hypothetical protein
MAITLPTPTGNTGTNDWADVFANDDQLKTEIDARDDNYQTIAIGNGFINPDTAASTAVFGAIGALLSTTNTATLGGPVAVYFDDADYTISSKTQKLRLRAQILTNATQPLITFTFGLYPVSSVAGTADQVALTLGTVTSGSTVAFASPAASTIHQNNSGDFTIPSDGQYVLGIVLSGTVTNNAVATVHCQLQTRWV